MATNIIYILVFLIFSFLLYLIARSILRGLRKKIRINNNFFRKGCY